MMHCWGCTLLTTDIGKEGLCPACRHKARTDYAHAKQETWLYFCTVCGNEVYRKEHIQRHTKKLLHDLGVHSRMALFQHAERVGHRKCGLTGYLPIDERQGHVGYEVMATLPHSSPLLAVGKEEERAPERSRNDE